MEITENSKIKWSKTFKYLGFTISKEGTITEQMQYILNQTRVCIKQLSGVLWNTHITKNIEKRIFDSIVRSTMTYTAENWIIRKKDQSKIMATEMEYWRR